MPPKLDVIGSKTSNIVGKEWGLEKETTFAFGQFPTNSDPYNQGKCR